MNYDDINDETLYDIEAADYKTFHKINKIDNLLEKYQDVEEIELESTDHIITADSFCSKFVSILKDVEDIKTDLSLFKAELTVFQDKMEIVMEKLK